MLRALLARLARPESVSDDLVMHDAFAKLAGLYEATGDTVLLDVLDTTRIEGGFANEACSFYARVAKRESARAWIAGGGGAGIRRCVGLTLSEEELSRILSTSGP